MPAKIINEEDLERASYAFLHGCKILIFSLGFLMSETPLITPIKERGIVIIRIIIQIYFKDPRIPAVKAPKDLRVKRRNIKDMRKLL